MVFIWFYWQNFVYEIQNFSDLTTKSIKMYISMARSISIFIRLDLCIAMVFLWFYWQNPTREIPNLFGRNGETLGISS